MDNNLIVVKQLPIIEQQLQAIKAEVTAKVEKALSLVCSEDTVKEVKAIRAELNKDFKEFEDRRKEVKKAVLSPYEQFESVYKDCITDVFKKADTELKSKIEGVENGLKEQKTSEVKAYFDEYLQSKGIDFVTFEKANINVALSASATSLKRQAKAFIDRICDDLNLIDTQDHKDEILYEYKQNLNVSEAITKVVNRHRAIEESKAKTQVTDKPEPIEEVISEKPLETPKEVEDDKIYPLQFTVYGTKAQLKMLKDFILRSGIKYE